MTSIRSIRPLLAIAALTAAIALSPTSLFAQENAPNTTGLPMYPKLTTGSEYPSVKGEKGHYKVYTAQSSDPIAVVEAWYRKSLAHAIETKDDNSLTHGIVLTVGKDKVLIYNLGNSKSSVVELQKFLGG